jgi:hypothetical protein
MKIGRRGNTFITFLKKGRKGDCPESIRDLKLLKRFGNFRGNYIRRPSRRICESHWKKMPGKSRKNGI